ncbi:hypothetical protein JXB12_06385 [candidate division KSB1 bacterium]|nr:hypothetical protein [candidate division KSB1 bacterium]
MKKIFALTIISILLYPLLLYAQWLRPGPEEDPRDRDRRVPSSYLYLDAFDPIFLIDKPTANTLTIITDTQRETYQQYFHVNMRVYSNGGMIAGIDIGLTRALMLGIAFGGQNLIGSGDVMWNEAPGVHLKFKVLRELPNGFSPALSIGYDSQGYGRFYEEDNRYQIKSPGFYIVASKNNILSRAPRRNLTAIEMGIHGGINFSNENGESRNDMNLFLGAHLVLERELAIIWEYDSAMNDKTEKRYGSGSGYMNLAVRWMFLDQFYLEFALKDINKNTLDDDGNNVKYSNRELKIVYRRRLTS